MANRFSESVAKTAPVATRAFPLTSGGIAITYGSKLPIVLHCRHAGFSNPGMSSAIMKATGERRRIAAIKDEREQQLAGWRLDAKTLAYSIDSWDNVSENDAPLAVTPELGEELLLAMVEKNIDLFLSWRQWVYNEGNFVETPPGDPADLGK